MNKINRTDDEIIVDIRTAGMSFLAFNVEGVIRNILSLESTTFKMQYIEKCFNNQLKFSDSTINGTTTRVNAARRIVKSGKTMLALDIINKTNSVKTEVGISVCELILKILKGEVKLPELG